MNWRVTRIGCLSALVVAVSVGVSRHRQTFNALSPASPPEFLTPFELQPPLSPERDTVLELPSEQRKDSACFRAYARFYEHPIVQIRIAFGYKDARPARFVGDGYEANALINYLLLPCMRSYQACGFVQDDDDAELLSKEIIGPNGEPHTVLVRITNSAVGPDDEENRRDPFQSWQSERSHENFFGGLVSADAVFYDGHSRDGGGPDFFPPRLTLDGHVDYNWYSQNKPGLDLVLETLDEEVSVKLLGLFSCLSAGHFSDQILAKQPRLAMITSYKLMYYADAIRDMLGAISSLLNLSCKPEFDSAIRAESVGGFSRLRGFFVRD